MAEFIFKNLVKKENLTNKFFITSKGTSNEEQGNYMHPKAIKELEKHQIPYTSHYATQITRDDYEKYDLFIGMDRANIRNMTCIFGGDPQNKIRKLMDFTDHGGDVADPWYSGDFGTAYRDIYDGCAGLLQRLLREGTVRENIQ